MVIRVLISTSTYPRWESDTEPDFIAQLAQRLVECGMEVHVLAPHAPGAQREETLHGVHIHRYRYAPDFFEHLAYESGILSNLRHSPWKYALVLPFLFNQAWQLRILIRRLHIQVVHAHWLFPQGLLAAWIARRFHVPVLVTGHGSDLSALRGTFFARLHTWTLQQATHATVVSQAMRRSCLRLGIPAEKISVLPMGVDFAARFAAKELTVRDGLLFVGRLIPVKGCAILLKAFSQLSKLHHELRLTIVGDGPERPALEQYVTQHALSGKVRFLGAVANDKLGDYYRRASIVVMPSLQEGLGLVAVEALGSGCALVAHDLPALRDVVRDKETGLLVPIDDASALYTAIESLVNQPSLRERLAQAGRLEVLSRFDWSIISDGYSAILSELVDRAR